MNTILKRFKNRLRNMGYPSCNNRSITKALISFTTEIKNDIINPKGFGMTTYIPKKESDKKFLLRYFVLFE